MKDAIIFDKPFPDLRAITQAFQKLRPEFAPGLAQLLQNPEPPTLEALKDGSTIEPSKEAWSVYLLALELETKADRARLYTRTGI